MRTNSAVTYRLPELPMPKLRREARCFDSILQEALAYPEVESDNMSLDLRDPEVLLALDQLDQASKVLYEQIHSQTDQHNLVQARWSFPLQTDATLPLVLQLYQALALAAEFQCEYHLRELQECLEGGTLLSDYYRRVRNRQWNAYIAAGKAFSDLYSSFEALFNEIYEAKFPAGPQLPRFSFLRMFTTQWTRKVFSPLEACLTTSALNLLNSLRSERLLKSQSRLDDPRTLTLMKYHSIQDCAGLSRPRDFAQERPLPEPQSPASPAALPVPARRSARKQQSPHRKCGNRKGSAGCSGLARCRFSPIDPNVHPCDCTAGAMYVCRLRVKPVETPFRGEIYEQLDYCDCQITRGSR